MGNGAGASMNILQKIDFSWQMESCSDPFFSYDEYGLKVSFMIFLGEETRNADIGKWLSLYHVQDELQIPDKQYNDSGYRIAEFRFSSMESLYCTDRESGLASYIDAVNDPPAVYREVDTEHHILGYVFAGHDLFLSVKARTYDIDIQALE
jgi:hypothetical protein